MVDSSQFMAKLEDVNVFIVGRVRRRLSSDLRRIWPLDCTCLSSLPPIGLLLVSGQEELHLVLLGIHCQHPDADIVTQPIHTAP